MMSFDAPVEVMAIAPLLPADMAPFTVTEPAEATKVMLPRLFVVIPVTLILPVEALYENTELISDTLRSVLVAEDVTV